jgi:hypothetical protein
MNERRREEVTQALEADDTAAVEALAAGGALDVSATCGGRPLLASARSIPMAETLLRLGASLEKLSEWWAPGFWLRSLDADVAHFLVERGAKLTAHAAAGLGLCVSLERMLDADGELVHAKGGDGCTPLHFARDLAVAELLIARGAHVEARDDDHDSTPAQWLIGDAPEIVRLLFEHGARPDIFLAAALGDQAMAETLIAADPEGLDARIGKALFPPIGHKGRGGTILQWTLGFNAYPHQVARKKGHEGLFRVLFDRGAPRTRFLVACVLAMREEAESMAAERPGLVAALPDADLELLARYCWETNVNIEAVRLMLDLGFPIAHPETSHGWSPLHNAAWGGYADLVDLLIGRGAPVGMRDPRYGATPLGFAIHCATVDGRHPEGDYERVVGALIDAGSPWDPSIHPSGDDRVDRALAARLPPA